MHYLYKNTKDFDILNEEVKFKRLLIILKYKSSIKFINRRKKEDSLFSETVLIDFNFKRECVKNRLENYIIYSNTPYKLIKIPINHLTYYYFTSGSFYNTFDAKIHSINNKNIIKKNLDSLEILSSYPIFIKKEDAQLIKKVLEDSINNHLLKFRKAWKSDYEIAEIDVYDPSFDWWSDLNSKVYEISVIIQDLVSENKQMYGLFEEEAGLKDLEKEINKELDFLIEFYFYHDKRIAKEESLLKKRLVMKKILAHNTDERTKLVRSMLLEHKELKNNLLDKTALWSKKYPWKEYYYFLNMQKEYQKLIPLLLSYHTISWLVSSKVQVFVPHSIDFRGRMYSNSLLSPVYNKVIRPSIKLESPDSDWFNKVVNSEYFKNLKKHFVIGSREDYLRTLIKLELGKLYLKELVSAEKTYISITEIAERGELILTNSPRKLLDPDEEIYINSLRRFYKRIGVDEEPDNINLLLDSTASGQQVIAYIREVTDVDVLKKLNLSGNFEWYDPYYETIKEFFLYIEDKANSEEKEVIKQYFTRKTLKRAIMTSFYNATLYRITKNIHSSLPDSITNQDKLIINKFIKYLYIFLTNESLLKKFKMTSLSEINPLNSDFDPNYYNNESWRHRIKVNIDGSVRTMTFPFKMNKFLISAGIQDTDSIYRLNPIKEGGSHINIKKTATAMAPNTVHNIDSQIVSEILRKSKVPIYTIHDMFIVSIYSKHIVFDEINRFYSSRLKNKEYSLTILI